LKRIEKYKFIYIVLFLLTVVGVLSTNKTSYSNLTLEEKEAKIQLFSPVISKLVSSGVDSLFLIKLISDPSTRFDEKYVQIDVPFKSPAPTDTTKKVTTSKVYTKLVNEEAIRRITDFIETNERSFSVVEEKYKIDKEVLASLLWVETRHGDYLGYHHVVSVYICLALADQSEFIEYNMQRMKSKYKLSKKDYVQVKERLVKRSETKAKWARGELAAIYKIREKLTFSVLELYGSYAGAFGIPQFLPSSYNRFAIDGDSDGKVNLFNFDDAIYSCANYLKNSGFSSSEGDKRKAIYAYNHSQRYVNTIMTLAKKVKNNFTESLEVDTTQDLNDQE
jgi:membrane-bound lytic murein transglycosylase B